MLALDAEIQVAGLAEPIDTFRLLIEEPTDQVGRPNADVRVRPLLLTLSGPAATRDFFTEWGVDSYMRRSGWLVVYENDQTRWRLAFYDAYCVLHNTHFRPGKDRAAYVLTLALSPAAVTLNGVHSEIYSDLWWEKNPEVRLRALTKPADLLPGPGTRNGPIEHQPTPPQDPPPSPALSTLTGAPLAPKPPKTALDSKKKPLYAPTIAKWYKKGGSIEVLPNGNWKFTDWDHNSIVYERDEPKYDQYARQQVDIEDMQGNCTTDFDQADALAPLGPILPGNTWHHKQNLKTMQEVNSDIHQRFTHYGARSVLKRQRPAKNIPTKRKRP